MTKHILITGSQGFIGKNLCEYLSERDYDIYECDRKIGFCVTDITEEYLTSHKIDCVIHLAAQTSVWNTDNAAILRDNVDSFVYIFDLCKKLDIRFIYASSSCAYNRTSLYGLSKKFDEDYAAMNYFKGCGIRLHNVVSPDNPRADTLLGILLRSSDDNPTMLYNNGANIRHFTYVGDVCKAFERVLLGENYYNKKLYNVYNPKVCMLTELCSIAQQFYPHVRYELTDKRREKDMFVHFVDTTLPNIEGIPYTNMYGMFDKYIK